MTTSEPTVTKRVVVGVDGSEESKLALTWAAKIAQATVGYVEAVIAWQYPATFGWAVPPSEWDPAQDADKALVDAVDEVFGANRPANLQLTVSEGYPANVLLTAAHGAAMLVVGSRGHGGFAGMLLGSVSANVAEHAQCPVLVVHPDPAAPSA
ncbi:universal stress protein [Jatrophihabitans sp.]|uniref:universal stress protein n=1 Tax=Jatrophihabitans sp. TaxID=1932789 RepID=UPI0030C78359